MNTSTPTTTTTTVYPRSGDYLIVLPETALWRDADEIDLLARVVVSRTDALLSSITGRVGLALVIEDSALGAAWSPATRTFSVLTDGETYEISWEHAGWHCSIRVDAAACAIDHVDVPVVPAWTTDCEEVPEHEVWGAILRLLPDAEFGADEDGYLTVHTGLLYCGKHGENLIGRIVLP